MVLSGSVNYHPESAREPFLKSGFLTGTCEQTEGPGLKVDVQIFLATGRTRVEGTVVSIQNRTARDKEIPEM